MSSSNLDQLIIDSIKPQMLDIFLEYLESAEAMKSFREVLNELTNEKINDILDEDAACKRVATNLTPSIKDAAYDYIKELNIPIKNIEVILNSEVVHSDTDVYHKDFDKIIQFTSQKIPLLLKGPAGIGKNICVEQAAKALNLELYRCNSPQDKFELRGFIDANGVYQETAYYKAFTKGGMLLLDEMDNAMATALIAVNDAISNGEEEFPNGKKTMHKDFRVVATANTWGNGKSSEYIGRNKIDAATLDRFVCWEFSYDKDLERLLYPDDEILEVFWELRRVATENNLKQIFSMRGIKYAYILRKAGMDLKDIIKSCVIKGMNIDDVKMLISNVNISYGSNSFWDAMLDVRDSMCK